MSIIEQTATDVTSSMELPSLVYNVVYQMRYELVFVTGLGVLWLAALPSLSKATSKAPRKSKLPRERGAQAQKRARAEKLEGLEVSLEGGTQSSVSQREIVCLIHASPSDSQLTNASWILPRLTALCQSNAQRALALFKSALVKGLNPQEAPEDSEVLYVTLTTSLIRMGLLEEAQSLLRDLRQLGMAMSPSACASTIKIYTAKQCYRECLAMYDLMSVNLDTTHVDKSVWSCLLFCAVEAHTYDRCSNYFALLKSCGTPSSKDYWNMTRFCSVKGEWKMMREIIHEMHEAALDVDNVIYNTALAACVSANELGHAHNLLDEMAEVGGVTDVITYNTLMKGYANQGQMDECFKLYELMQERGLEPSQVTYGILLDGYNNNNEVDSAAKVFEIMAEKGCPMNTVLYTTLIKGYARAENVDGAMRVYQQMSADKNVKPDLITYSILLKANCDAGRMEKSLELVEGMLKNGLHPDEIIFNNLLSGCAKDSNAELAKRLYDDMIASGVKPSNATFSILIRLYSQCKLFDDAMDMLRREPSKHNVEIEARLFSQLIHCCIRARQGRRAIDAYEMMVGHSTPPASLHSSMLTMCVKLNMFDTAADILEIVAAKGGRVDARDANMVLSAAARKHKSACVETIRKAMTALRIAVDPSV